MKFKQNTCEIFMSIVNGDDDPNINSSLSFRYIWWCAVITGINKYNIFKDKNTINIGKTISDQVINTKNTLYFMFQVMFSVDSEKKFLDEEIFILTQ